MIWPGDKYPEEDIHELFKHSMQYLTKYPYSSLSQLHKHLIAKLGACSYHHVAAVWPLLKNACGISCFDTKFHSITHFKPKKTGSFGDGAKSEYTDLTIKEE